jgi:hypothetical protein
MMGGIHQVRRSDGLRWHDVYTRFHRHSSRYSRNNTVITSTISEAALLVLLMGGFMKYAAEMASAWHDIHTKFHKYRFRLSMLLKVTHIHSDRQQGHLISQVSFFRNKESRPKQSRKQFYSNLRTDFFTASVVS